MQPLDPIGILSYLVTQYPNLAHYATPILFYFGIFWWTIKLITTYVPPPVAGSKLVPLWNFMNFFMLHVKWASNAVVPGMKQEVRDTALVSAQVAKDAPETQVVASNGSSIVSGGGISNGVVGVLLLVGVFLVGCAGLQANITATLANPDVIKLWGIAQGLGEVVLGAAESADPGLTTVVTGIKTIISDGKSLVVLAKTDVVAAKKLQTDAEQLTLLAAPLIKVVKN